jgi:hypothetical protein
MREGSIFVVLIFPNPWPPDQPITILSKRSDSDLVSLAADPSGRLKLSVVTDGEALVDRVFQPLRIEGGGRAIVSIIWSPAGASLHVNGQEIKADLAAGEAHYTFPKSAEPVDGGIILPGIDLNAGKSEAEQLFLATVADIDAKLVQPNRYTLIRAAGLLRQLFLDEKPLVHVVNRNHRAKLLFERIEYGTQLPLSPDAHWVNPDCSQFPKAQSVSISMDAFLKSPCLTLHQHTASIADLIKVCAHVKGGIHLGKATTDEEKALIDWDEAIKLIGEQPSLLAIGGTCRVALHGLKPLVSAITGTRTKSRI